MTAKRLVILTGLLLLGCSGSRTAVGEVATAADDVAELDARTQLRINTEALLSGADEEIRSDAATILLYSEGGQARKALLEALEDSNNPAASIAVCKGLGRARMLKKAPRDKDDFIKPLVAVLGVREATVAKAAAEAALLYQYREIGDELEKLAKSQSASVRGRLNAIYALKLQLDTKAIICLMDLMDDKDAQVGFGAAEALRSIGIPTSKDPKVRKQIVGELREKGMGVFQRDWLVRQEARIAELENERNAWRQLYLGSLDRIYTAMSDDVEKGKVLTEQLNNAEPRVKLWALDKVAQWRMGTQSVLPGDLGAVLVKLISDENREVRLNTAKLLSLMGEVNSAERLVEQLAVETDEEVKLEMFVALGSACYYAYRPNSGIQIPPGIRTQTLELASAYLFDPYAEKAQKAVQVIRKLLELEGLPVESADKYLAILADRYQRGQEAGNSPLRGELLGVMAGLCAQGLYKAEATKRFQPVFEQAISDQMDAVRQAAMQGLANIDKPRALKLLRKDFANDRSPAVRAKLIGLASEVGTVEDLGWLAEKLGGNADSRAAWQAMLRIFGDTDLETCREWLGKWESAQSAVKLTDEQWIGFLEVFERRPGIESQPELARTLKNKLAHLYTTAGQYERAAEYLGLLRESAKTAEEKERLLVALLDVYLRWPRTEAAVRLVNNCLLERDLGADGSVVRTINAYFATASDPNVLLQALRNMKSSEPRPQWQKVMDGWTERFLSEVPAAAASEHLESKG